MLYTNIDQFTNKRDDLSMLIAGNEPDLILLSEVIPKAQVKPMSHAILSLPGYAMYLNFDPADCNLGRSGCRGLCIFVSSKWQATEVLFPNCSFKEHLWVTVSLKKADKLLVGCIYRSPSSSGATSTADLVSLLKASSSMNFTHIVVAGDVNMPQIDWASNFSSAPDGLTTSLRACKSVD